MNGFNKGKNGNLENTIPGCLGRMVNLFDLNAGVGGNKLLTAVPHLADPLSRSQSDVSRICLAGDIIEDKVMLVELRRPSSYKNSNGTPIKMLIAQEMSKEVKAKQNSPNLVAKLMGLDALPQHQHDSSSRRSHLRGHSRSHSGIFIDSMQRDVTYLDADGHHEGHQFQEQREYKDVYDIWQQSSRTDCRGDRSSQKGRYNDIENDKKMALVRQKFMEAKRLSTDEKLRQSKQFQDALEVLSSNKDLFLNFLQEPNSLFSQHISSFPSIPPPDAKRITVLRPSMMVNGNKITGPGKKAEKQIKATAPVSHLNKWEKSDPGFSSLPPECYKLHDNSSQPTRIVVLKPNPGKPRDIKTVSSLPSSRRISNEGFFGDQEDIGVLESREVGGEITQQMGGNLSRHRRDETLLSSEFSNGYIGDKSSFNKSEMEFAAGNLSDSEVMSPTSRHSWDYINQFGSPYSVSSFSRMSYSPESSVCREAKKRLSERWAMMASNGSCQEQRHVRRSSSTLGEMLALSDVKKTFKPGKECIIDEQESSGTASWLTTDLSKEEIVDGSPRSLMRSKSVPVSSTSSDARLDMKASDSETGETYGIKAAAKERSVKSSFKGRVSNLFFSRNKKSSKEKPDQSKNESLFAGVAPCSPLNFSLDDGSKSVTALEVKGALLSGLQGSSRKLSSQASCDKKQGIILPEDKFSAAKPENQDQPSPVSVLEPRFEEDEHTAAELCRNFKPAGSEFRVHALKSNLIDKSPPIGSIARTLSWDESAVGTSTLYPSRSSPVAPIGGGMEEKDYFTLVQALLLEAGLDGDVQLSWHSAESPLDPSLRDKFVFSDEKTALHDAKRRQRRSIKKLVFDCVNSALTEIYGPGTCNGPELSGRVWAQMKGWGYGEVGEEGGDHGSLVVERVVKREVVGRGWNEQLGLEVDDITNEIEAKLVEELVQVAVVELTGSV